MPDFCQADLRTGQCALKTTPPDCLFRSAKPCWQRFDIEECIAHRLMQLMDKINETGSGKRWFAGQGDQ
ncbi:hypothetical protein CKF43_15510 [Pantoea graminicola]|nr:hypothetical protein CKF43_15510 [Pantoea sp. ARC607]